MNRVHFRVALATLGLPAVVAAAALTVRTAWSDRLPDNVATHWGPSGAPDSASGLDSLTLWTTVLTLTLAVVFTVTAFLLLRSGRGAHRPLIGLAAALAAAPSAGMFGPLITTVDRESWREASSAWWPVAGLLGVCALVGVLAWAIAPDVPPTKTRSAAGTESVGLASGERAVWIGGTTNLPLAAFCAFGPAAVLAMISLLSSASAAWGVVALTTAVGVLAALGVSRVQVTVDSDGVAIRMGVLGYPRRTVPLSDITSATTESLTLLGAGGLGVRTNTSGDVYYKCRGGAALALTLNSNRRVIATVDHPDQAAGLVNDLVRQAADRAG